MGVAKKGKEWNQLQLRIAYGLIVDKLSRSAIAEQLACSMPTVNKIAAYIKHGHEPPTLDLAEIAKAPMPTSSPVTKLHGASPWTGADGTQKQQEPKPPPDTPPPGKSLNKPNPQGSTDAASQTSILQFIPQVQKLPMTPNIYISYMCAVKNGYEGDLGDWLSLVSLDFWAGRGRNMFSEVAGFNPAHEKDGGNGAKPQEPAAEEVEPDGVTAG